VPVTRSRACACVCVRLTTITIRYAPPHPRSRWPLAANILDPVRCSVVCQGPAQILQAAPHPHTQIICCVIECSWTRNEVPVV
jgi:hypothetical protein